MPRRPEGAAPMTTAQRVQRHRQNQTSRLVALQGEVDRLRAALLALAQGVAPYAPPGLPTIRTAIALAHDVPETLVEAGPDGAWRVLVQPS